MLYQKPEMEITIFEQHDVVTTSDGTVSGISPGEGDWDL